MGLTVSVLLSADNIPNRQFDVRSRCQLRRYSEHRGIEILTGVNATSLTRDDTERLAGRRLHADQPVDIYAAGDVAEHDGSTSCVGVVAADQGEIAAFNALGGRRRYGGHMRSTLLKGRGIDLLAVGQINSDGKSMCAIVSEHPERFKYRKLILASGCLLGAILIGYPAAEGSFGFQPG